MNTAKIEQLVEKVQSLPDPVAREAALDLVQAVMDFHAAGLERMMDIIFDPETGGSPGAAIASDPLAGSMLLLHDLHPLDLNARVLRALDQPEFRSRGAKVEVVSIEDGVIRVRCEGGASLKAAVETALVEAAPDAASIVVEGGAGELGHSFVPLTQLMAG